MPCFHPVTAYKSRTVNPSGKRSLVFQESQGLLASKLQIPCGGCIGCRIDKSSAWATRLMHESKWHEQKSFLTLTYDELNLPSNGSLDKTHFQLFMKRFRKKHGGKIRFFMCGEYGDTTQRPHYHAIIYGCDFSDKRRHSTNPQGNTLWVSDTLDQLWSHGHCYIGEVTQESCAYVARYIMKKVTGDMAQSHYERITPEGEIYQLQPEYITMSLKPGIGFQHYQSYKSDFYPSDYAVVKGKKVPVPKYYDRQLEKENPELFESIKSSRISRAKKNKADNTPDRLAVRKTVLKSKLSKLSRPL
jgi:hypothetical protein